MINIFMSYDNSGFDEAVKHGDTVPFNESELHEMIAFLVSWAEHDMQRGLCINYQIYDESGKTLIDSSNTIPNEAA